jgi:hypothetical protein
MRQIDEASQQQSAAYQQHNRERHLSNDEQCLSAMRAKRD